MSKTVHIRVSDIELAQIAKLLEGKISFSSRSQLVRVFLTSVLASMYAMKKIEDISGEEAKAYLARVFNEDKVAHELLDLEVVEGIANQPEQSEQRVSESLRDVIAAQVAETQYKEALASSPSRSTTEQQGNVDESKVTLPPWLRPGMMSVEDLLKDAKPGSLAEEALETGDDELIYSLIIIYSSMPSDQIPTDKEKLTTLINATRPTVRRWLKGEQNNDISD